MMEEAQQEGRHWKMQEEESPWKRGTGLHER
jgi:hypothetical protein